MKKNFLIFFVNFLLFLLFLNNATASSSDPKKFIQKIVDEAKKILVDTNSPEYKAEKLTEIAKLNVDIEGVSLYALGSYRKDLNNDQKKQYTILFEEYFIKTFVSRLTDYSEPKIDVISAEKKMKNTLLYQAYFLQLIKRPK